MLPSQAKQRSATLRGNGSAVKVSISVAFSLLRLRDGLHDFIQDRMGWHTATLELRNAMVTHVGQGGMSCRNLIHASDSTVNLPSLEPQPSQTGPYTSSEPRRILKNSPLISQHQSHSIHCSQPAPQFPEPGQRPNRQTVQLTLPSRYTYRNSHWRRIDSLQRGSSARKADCLGLLHYKVSCAHPHSITS